MISNDGELQGQESPKCEVLRVAMIGHKRIPSREGGVEIVVDELASRMVQKGLKVTCYNRRGHHVSGTEYDESKRKEYNGIQIKHVWTINAKGLAALTSSFFGAVCIAFGKYDVAHFHAEGPCAMLWLPKITGKRCIATIHGLDHQRAKWGKAGKKYILFGEKVAAKRADEIIVLSKNVQDYFRNVYGRETTFIPNGVSMPQRLEVNLIGNKYNLSKDSYILFLGRIVPEKGIEYLIKAFQNVSTSKKLVIAGGSSDTNDFVEQVKELAKEDSRILFTGFVFGEILSELYSNSYVYILPSDVEGMPLSLLEAMSYGNCCLTSDIEECTEVVENAAVTFRKGDIENLTSKLQMLVDSPQYVDEIRSTASDHICMKYQWEDVVDKTIHLYSKAICEKR